MPFRKLGDPWKTLGGKGGVLGGVSGGGVPVTFLYRDDFLTNIAASPPSPRTAEPGPGTAVIVDTNNVLTIAGRRLDFGAGGNNFGDPGYFGSAQTRACGLSMFTEILLSTNNKFNAFGWNNAQAGPSTRQAVYFRDAALIKPYVNGVIVNSGDPYVSGVSYKMAFPLRTSGYYLIIKGGIYDGWTVLWITETNNTATLYPSSTNNGGGNEALFSHDFIRVSQLPAPWNNDFGIATDRLEGARSPGDGFQHEADCMLEFDMTTVPAALQAEVHFRKQDATNYMAITVNSAGDLELDEVVGGVTNQLGVSAGVIANGDHITAQIVGSTIRVFDGTTLRITSAVASNFTTMANGELATEGTGGSVSDIVATPRVLSGVAAEALDRVVNV